MEAMTDLLVEAFMATGIFSVGMLVVYRVLEKALG